MPDDTSVGKQSTHLVGGPLQGTPADHAGEAAGRYRIVESHAHGGLGEVFLAHDTELHRSVALKEIRPELAGHADLRARFVLEAEITGGLEHPGIVPVYGLGAYADGRPFYAMRFIRGESLTAAIARLHDSQAERRDGSARILELRKLLGSFITVCNTVAYAHSRGVIHRDLKPDNIMLGAYGETLLVDWGLAKLVASPEDLAEHGGDAAASDWSTAAICPSAAVDSTPTEMGTAIGTLSYMSPEQAAGLIDQLGPASDIYSLGATLYVLLTGEVPFAVDATREEVMRAIIVGRFLGPRTRKAEIPRALEAICLKAMALDPLRRYASARTLAEDVEAWLADAPVRAWREPLRIRLGRWMRRHRTAVSGAGAALLVAMVCLLVGVILLTRANRREHDARDLAERREEEAQHNFRMARDAVDQYLTRVSQDPRLAAQDLEPLRRELLQTAREFYEQFVAQQPREPQLQAERAWACFRLAEITRQIGSGREAIELLEKAKDAFGTLSRQFPADAKYCSGVAKSRLELGLLRLDNGQTNEAATELQAARQVAEALTAGNPKVASYQMDLADIHQALARLYTADKQFAAAEAHYQRALEVHSRLAKGMPDEPQFQSALAGTRSNLGLLYQLCSRPQEAVLSLTAAREIQNRLVAKYPNNLQYQSDLATTCNNLAVLYGSLSGRLAEAEAEAAHKTALEVRKRLAEAHRYVIQYQGDLARSYNNLATLFCQHGRLAEAEKAYLAAREIHQQLSDEHPEVPEYQNDLAATLNNLGNLFSDVDRRQEAESAFRKAIEIRQRLAIRYPEHSDYQNDLAATYNNLATLLPQLGRLDEAEAAYQAALKIRRKLSERYRDVGDYRFDLGTTYANLGQLAKSRDHFEAAKQYCTQAIALLENDGKPRFENSLATHALRNAYWGCAEADDRLGLHAEALAAWDRAIALDPGEGRNMLRLGRAESLAEVGQHARAAAEVHDLLEPAQDFGPVLYRLAVIDAIAAAAAAKDASLSTAQRPQLQERYTAESVAILQKAQRAGYFDDPSHRKALHDDPRWEPFRSREDFRKAVGN